MATSRLLTTRNHHHHLFLHHSPLSLLRPFSLFTPTSPPPHSHPLPSPFTPTPFRFFSSSTSSTHELSTITEYELRNLGHVDGSSLIIPDLVGDSIFPVRAVVGLLDGFHHLTCLPWWIVIASSTLALRITLFPWVVLQLHKMKHIADSMPKLPPPLPPPFSGISFADQFSLFRKERKAIGCPSFLWFLASFSVQLPCFLLWMTSIRRMSLNQYPGFDTGGVLWFQDLTVEPSGSFGLIPPLLIAGLHFCNVQIGFRGSSIGEQAGFLFFLARLYKKYLELLTLPLLFVGFYLPQGSLVYWVTNSSLTLIQQLCLQHPQIRKSLGLPDKEAERIAAGSEKDVNVKLDAPRKPRLISGFDMSPDELIEQSVKYLMAGKLEKSTNMLRLAVDKDPDCFKAWTTLGQTMLHQCLFEEAAEYAEFAIFKISLLEDQTDPEALDFLIQASALAGAAFYQQGKLAEAFAHFKRVTDMKEPENEAVKNRYYQGLVAFACLLTTEGRKDEAVRYFNMAIAYDPKYAAFLQNANLEDKADDFVSDLTGSRRADY